MRLTRTLPGIITPQEPAVRINNTLYRKLMASARVHKRSAKKELETILENYL
jgi:hypothetical protein